MKLTLLTPTGDRPEAFALCEKYMDRQTKAGKDSICQWLVLDDGKVPTICTKGQDLHRNESWSGPGSLVSKVRHALEHNLIKGDALVFIEDDDWYSPNYLEIMAARLTEYDLVGEGNACYYNVELRWWCEHNNMTHASLCQTGIVRGLFALLLRQVMVDDSPFIDSRIWNWGVVKKKVFAPLEQRTCIGIKSMPGRKGYGVGHNCNRTGRHATRPVNYDTSSNHLQFLIGADDAEVYEKYYNKIPKTNVAELVPINKSPIGHKYGAEWLRVLGHLKGHRVTGMELGGYHGDAAEWFLDNIITHPESVFMYVSEFNGNIEHALKGIDCSKNGEIVRNKLAAHPHSLWIQTGVPHVVMRDSIFELDFIYSNADLSTRGALRDAVYAFDLLKVGGILIMGNYRWNLMPDRLDCPKTGLDAFITCYGKHIDVLATADQIIIKKESK